jgi:hypothetical protein
MKIAPLLSAFTCGYLFVCNFRGSPFWPVCWTQEWRRSNSRVAAIFWLGTERWCLALQHTRCLVLNTRDGLFWNTRNGLFWNTRNGLFWNTRNGLFLVIYLMSFNEWWVIITFIIVETWFVQCPVKIWLQLVNLTYVILECNRQSKMVSL